MIRTHTDTVVAVMTDRQAVRDGTVGESPRNSMSLVAGVVVGIESAVALGISATGPQPTTIGPADSPPEAVRERRHRPHVVVMSQDEADRLALDIAVSANSPAGDWRWLTAAAMAQTRRDNWNGVERRHAITRRRRATSSMARSTFKICGGSGCGGMTNTG